MFLLREVHAGDLDALQAVAAHLDSVNLPDDRQVLAELIDVSERSFSGQLDLFQRQYIFALFDLTQGQRLIGTSMIHAQHGTRRAPHIYFDVLRDERYSETLDRHVVHRVLRIGYNYSGPTEIGGLVVLPEYRRHPAALGRWLSYVRFLYIALHRDRFKGEILSELLPPLETDGTSLLWEALGRHFTGMSYQEADRISQTNKEFIRALFPAEPIYASLLPPRVQEAIGQVGPDTRGVEKMLRRIGFHYAERIDPFDGGPHFSAQTDEVTLVRASRRARVAAAESGGRAAANDAGFALISVERDRPPHFRATGARVHIDEPGPAQAQRVMGAPDVLALPVPRGLPRVHLDAEARAILSVEPGEEVGILPV